jgi:predicted MFS family arabinose efflux permease
MYGAGALLAAIFGWLGDRLKRVGHLAALGLLALNGYAVFHGAWPFWAQCLLSLFEGLLVSGYLYPRFVTLVQRSVPADRVGYAMSLLIPMFYLGGLASGFVFGDLVERLGWNIASTLSTALPAALALVITFFYDPSQVRGEA